MAEVKTRRATSERDPVSVRIGGRLRRARHKAGLTQQQLAAERYTKAYVSALENALVKPSMSALDYLARRLGTTAGQLMADDEPRWTRLEADLQLAAGNWQVAADAYRELISSAPNAGTRAELLRGEAEALARLDRGAEAAASASQAVELFESAGRDTDAALASYWLAAALFYQDNVAEAKSILQAVLGKVRAGLRVEPDFELRLLMALSSNEAREGNHQVALSYLQEVRSLADGLDDRRRAVYLFDLAHSYCEIGDFEAAIRTGYASLTLFSASETTVEIAKLENELALAHLGTGNITRAAELAASAHKRFADLDDERLLAHVIDTEAQVEAARNNWPEALRLTEEALSVAEHSGNKVAAAGALTTAARAHAALSDRVQAEAAFERAAALCRDINRPKLLRRVLTEWADLVAESGDHAAAFALTKEALRT